MSQNDENDTRQRLAQVTDAGHFEKLATAVLREEDAHCRRLAHSGSTRKARRSRVPWMGSCTPQWTASGTCWRCITQHVA